MRKNKNETDQWPFDPVTFGAFGVLGGVLAFIFSDQAPLLISGGLILGICTPIKLSRWINK
ncbi:MAG: hypothetical protein WEB57_10615 [Pseudohongiellaceae bacterium]